MQPLLAAGFQWPEIAVTIVAIIALGISHRSVHGRK
jgi:hypothetical protein